MAAAAAVRGPTTAVVQVAAPHCVVFVAVAVLVGTPLPPPRVTKPSRTSCAVRLRRPAWP